MLYIGFYRRFYWIQGFGESLKITILFNILLCIWENGGLEMGWDYFKVIFFIFDLVGDLFRVLSQIRKGYKGYVQGQVQFRRVGTRIILSFLGLNLGIFQSCYSILNVSVWSFVFNIVVQKYCCFGQQIFWFFVFQNQGRLVQFLRIFGIWGRTFLCILSWFFKLLSFQRCSSGLDGLETI